MKAINDFATRYNKKNPKKPLIQINVGMGLNDLKNQLYENNNKADYILKGITFTEFGGYKGDWQEEQYIVWKM